LRCGVPVRQGETNKLNAPLLPSADAALGDEDSAARYPCHLLPSTTFLRLLRLFAAKIIAIFRSNDVVAKI
jgi:hypothetical protein